MEDAAPPNDSGANDATDEIEMTDASDAATDASDAAADASDAAADATID